MKDNIYQADTKLVKELLHSWLEKSIDTNGIKWVQQKSEELNSEGFEKKFFLAFSGAPRFTGRVNLNLSEKDLLNADKLRNGWKPENISSDKAARIFLILSLPIQDEKEYVKFLDKIFGSADVGELEALYSTLPLLPFPKAHIARAREGLRSNMKSIFEAVAIKNPFPADYFEEEPWNHLVLKALFVDSSINDIYGIDERANQNLAGMLSDYAHERWAAGREVNPLLWRPIGKYINENIIKDIKKLFDSPILADRKAAALACSQSDFPEAQKLLAQHPELMEQTKKEIINWNNITEA